MVRALFSAVNTPSFFHDRAAASQWPRRAVEAFIGIIPREDFGLD